jgi:hypothetical protein
VRNGSWLLATFTRSTGMLVSASLRSLAVPTLTIATTFFSLALAAGLRLSGAKGEPVQTPHVDGQDADGKVKHQLRNR